ncbi:type II secretion system inner membrane protein GspF [Inmirania thermothiophila]|uniref:General secretion pathway protein F n=1 Tax=Inmirania thermothiophila TaxID=1750597 RepID=A0A3N1XSG0_9GAMM|nr:type II secretion system inner membrane protein GspF [Inmirania thermothiophila]ROR29575.1 general secretion pathway protein F [Inmirania thermothiophila]
MGAFRYQALDARGRTRRGLIEADGPRQARQRLREQGLVPLAVEAEAAPTPGGGTRRDALGGADLVLAMRQLATLARAAVPVGEALAIAAAQSEGRRARAVLLGVRARIREGQSLAAALAAYPRAFPRIVQATVAAGERTGRLAEVLERLADYLEHRRQVRQRLALALLYPSLLVTVAFLVTALLVTYVVPQVVQVFVDMGQALPWATRLLIAISDAARDRGPAAALATAAALAAAAAALRRPAPRRAFDALLLRLPLLGRVLRGVQAARFARTFSILAASGVPALEAMGLAAQVLGNRPMREAVETAAARVREGSPIHEALARSGLFPPLLVHLVASGEGSGELERMLERAAAALERETETQIGLALGLLEPALILLMGGLVLFVVVAVLLPLFELNQLVGP